MRPSTQSADAAATRPGAAAGTTSRPADAQTASKHADADATATTATEAVTAGDESGAAANAAENGSEPAANAAENGSEPAANAAGMTGDFADLTRRGRRLLGYAAFFSLFVNLFQLVVPIYMMQVFDRVVTGRSLATLAYLTLIAGSALVVMGIIEILRGRIMGRIGAWWAAGLSPALFGRTVDAALDREAYSTEALRDLNTVKSFFSSPSLNALFDAPWVPIYLLLIFALHPVLGAIAAFGALLLFAMASLNEWLTRRPLQQSAMVTATAFNQVQAAVRNAEVADAMGMVAALRRRWLVTAEAADQLQARASELANLLLAISKTLRLGLQLAMLGAGAILVVDQKLTGGAMIAGSILLGRALAPVEQAIGGWKQLVAARSAFAQLKSLFSGPLRRPSDMRLPAPVGNLTLEEVSLQMEGATRPIINNVSFAVAPGRALAIIGPSASGKSTLARLIVGTWQPSQGKVRLDGADIYSWSRADVGCHIGYLPQDIELFSGTVRDNIARMAAAEPEAVVAAAELAGVHRMILALPQGYDTEVGDGGAFLSGGQRQRIGLARALFGNPRLVVLDEPNANLDAEGEEALAAAISHIKQTGATVVVIAHRPSVLKVVDRILVLREGAVDICDEREQVIAYLTRPTGGAPAAIGAPNPPPPQQMRLAAQGGAS